MWEDFENLLRCGKLFHVFRRSSVYSCIKLEIGVSLFEDHIVFKSADQDNYVYLSGKKLGYMYMPHSTFGLAILHSGS